jgi:hypothetical protein
MPYDSQAKDEAPLGRKFGRYTSAYRNESKIEEKERDAVGMGEI